MKQKLVIIGANDFQNQLILKAQLKGYVTHVFAWKDGAAGEKSADFFYPISIIEKETIFEVCKKIQPVGICSVGSDVAVTTVNYVANCLGLTANSNKSSFLCTNKHAMRVAFQNGLNPSPKSLLIEKGMDINAIDIKFPVIVKPTDRSGSRGITKITEKSQLKSAIARAWQESFEGKALIEEFVEGDEFSVEFVSWRGKHVFLALTKKYTTDAPNFIEVGHYQPASVSSEIMQEIIEVVVKALDTLQIKNGASHSEIKIDRDGTVKIIEIGARMGGDCIGSDLVQISTGYDFLSMVIDIACGNPPEFKKIYQPRFAFIRFLFSQEDIYTLEMIKESNTNVLYRVSEIELIDNREVLDSASRFGYYILATSDEIKMQKLIKKIGC